MRAWWWGIMVCLLAGCQVNPIKEAYRERAELLAPKPSIPAGVEEVFEKDYADAIDAARKDPTSKNITRVVDSGTTVNALHCGSWFGRTTKAENGLVASDHNLGVFSAFMTTLAGIWRWSPGAVAGLGATEVAVHGFGNNLRGAIGAPASYTVQQSLRDELKVCSANLAKAKDLTLGEVIIWIEECAAKCSSGAASAITTEALQARGVGPKP